MSARLTLRCLLAMALLVAPVATAPAQQPDETAEARELLAAAGLEPIGRRGDIIRYTLRRGYSGRRPPTARIVQVDWPYPAEGSPVGDDDRPRAVDIELAYADGTWRIARRREARMHPVTFHRLVDNVAAAVAVVGLRQNPRGSVTVCAHADTSRFDLSLPDQRLLLSRAAHCSDDAPAVVAGGLLTRAVETSIALEEDD